MSLSEKELLAKKTVDAFMDRWMNDPSFINNLKTDPKSALKSCGIEPWDQLIESLSNIDAGTPIEELQQRVSKGTTLN